MNSSVCIRQVRLLSRAALERLHVIPNEGLIWKANENDPRKHTAQHEALYYTLPSDQKELLQIYGRPSPFNIPTTDFNKIIDMMPIMIREPTLLGIDYFRKLAQKDNFPNVRLLYYGDRGHGKTHTLAHLIHYLHLEESHLILQIKDVRKFTKSPWEKCESTSRPGRVDTPVNAAMLLQQIRIQNAAILERLQDKLVSSKDYTWSLRETTKAGDPLVSIIDHGVNRVTHASDCLAVLIKELMLASDVGKIKLASFLDNIKYLFQDVADLNLKHADHSRMFIDEITVARAIKKLIKGTYKNGLVVATCDDCMPTSKTELNKSPRDILGVEGWNHFDPCLPIHVPKYSRKEFESCMNMYQDIGWLVRPEARTQEVRDELRFLSGMNPEEVFYLCKAI